MQHVLRCDYEACRQYLVNLEQAFLLDQGSQALGALLSHRCDGNRNILHAAISVCFPVSNKETKEEEGKVVRSAVNIRVPGLPAFLCSMLNGHAVTFQKLKGQRETHLQSAFLLWRRLPMPSLWFQVIALEIGRGPPAVEGK